MNMKRLLSVAAAALTLAGCAALQNIHHRTDNPYQQRLFVEKYLDPANSALDAQIARTIDALRALPNSAELHNQLGQLLVQKGFPKDAETEFERAVNSDRHFYPAWYNLGLLRMARGNTAGAHVAFLSTVHEKPGHSQALFQLGLMEEQSGHIDSALDYYAKAYSINHALLDVRVNPRILDTKLVDLTLLRLYAKTHARDSMRFLNTPPGYTQQTLTQPADSQASAAQPAPSATTPTPSTNMSQPKPPL
jgi:tetratricopeptide (TPR) repeat protein